MLSSKAYHERRGRVFGPLVKISLESYSKNESPVPTTGMRTKNGLKLPLTYACTCVSTNAGKEYDMLQPCELLDSNTKTRNIPCRAHISFGSIEFFRLALRRPRTPLSLMIESGRFFHETASKCVDEAETTSLKTTARCWGRWEMSCFFVVKVGEDLLLAQQAQPKCTCEHSPAVGGEFLSGNVCDDLALNRKKHSRDAAALATVFVNHPALLYRLHQLKFLLPSIFFYRRVLNAFILPTFVPPLVACSAWSRYHSSFTT
jgi:hypothetical protein